MRGAWIALALVLSWLPASAQPVEPPTADDTSILTFLRAVEASVSATSRQGWLDLLSTTLNRDEALEFFDTSVPEGVTRVVVKERDRAPLVDTPPGEGYQLIVEVFIESGPRGRIATWNVGIRKPNRDAEEQPWRIDAIERMSSVEGLYRLELDARTQYAAQNLATAWLALYVGRLGLPALDRGTLAVPRTTRSADLAPTGRSATRLAP